MNQPLPGAAVLDFVGFRERRDARLARAARAARSRYLLWYPGIGYIQQNSSVSRLSRDLSGSGARERY